MGTWTAKQPDGSSVALDLTKDAKYTWKFTRQDQSHDVGGTYTIADNLLILNQDGRPAMVGQVAQAGDRSFNFRLAGSPASDPGLSFAK